LTQRSTDRAAIFLQQKRRLLLRVGIPRIEDVVAEVEEGLAMQLIRAGLGEDLDAAVAQLGELGRERILVDAHFADRVLGRELTAAESVDEDLAAFRAGGGSGQRLQIVAAQNRGSGVVGWVRGNTGSG